MKSSRGKEKLISNGFVYRHERSKRDNHYWVCERKQCKGRGILRGCNEYNSRDGQFEMSCAHNHAAEEGRETVLRATTAMTEEGTTSTAVPAAIVQSHREKLSRQVAPHLPSEEALRQRIRRLRRIKFPAEPQTRGQINIPQDLKNTLGDDAFLLFDSADELRNDEYEDDDDLGRILCFGTLECLRKLAESPIWFCDGTFKTSPRLFAQVYTIHGMIENVCFPFVYALLPGKSKEVYTTLFREVTVIAEENDITLNPRNIMTDFELAAMNAIRGQFPNARISGCLFHLGQNIYRRVQKEGMTETYKDDERFRMSVKKLISLPWLPPEDIPAAFHNLKESAPAQAQRIFSFFEVTYVLGRIIPQRGKGRRRNVPLRHPPRFPPDVWSIHHLLQDSFPRTNNFQEAWHRRFECVVARHHLGVYPTIQEFRKEQQRTDHGITRGEAGHKMNRPQTAVNKQREVRLNTLIANFTDGRCTIEGYLRGIAHNYDLGDDNDVTELSDESDESDSAEFSAFLL